MELKITTAHRNVLIAADSNATVERTHPTEKRSRAIAAPDDSIPSHNNPIPSRNNPIAERNNAINERNVASAGHNVEAAECNVALTGRNFSSASVTLRSANATMRSRSTWLRPDGLFTDWALSELRNRARAMSKRMALSREVIDSIAQALYFDYTVEQLYRFWQRHREVVAEEQAPATP